MRDFILNVLCISIPEEFFITYIILFMLKTLRIVNHNYLDIHDNFKENFLKVFFISVLPMALLSNILIFYKVDNIIISFICLILMPTSIVLMTFDNIKKYKSLLLLIIPLILVSSLGCMLLEAAIQTICYKTLFTFTNTNFDFFYATEYKKIILTLLPRFFEYIILSLIIFKSNIVIKTNVINEFIRNKVLLIIITIYIIINSIGFIIIFKNIIDNDFLNKLNFSKWSQVFITIILIFWMCSNIIIVWLVPTIIQMNEKYRNKYGKGLK